MKFVNLFVVALCLSCFALAKKKRKSLMARQFNVKIYVDSAKTFSEGTLDAKDVKIPPEGDKKKGIHFAIKTLDDSLKNLIVDSSIAGLKYIPYRILSVEFTGEMPEKSAKSLSAIVLRDGKTYTVRLEFEYDAEWDVITNQELTNLITWLNTNRANRQSEILTLKTNLKKQGTEYNELVNSLNSAKGGSEAVGKKIKENIESITKLDADNKSLDDQLVESQKAISDKSIALKAANDAVMNSENKIAEYKQQIESLKKTIENLKQSVNDKASAIQNANSRLSSSEKTLRTKLSEIREEYGKDASKLDSVITDLIDNKNLDNALKTLRSLYP
jgi:DNA repair exonuclease SbcCD ATPase subunit